MELDAVVRRRAKFEAVEILNSSLLPPGPDTLLAGFSTSKDFNMDHVMLLGAQLGVKVGAAIKN